MNQKRKELHFVAGVIPFGQSLKLLRHLRDTAQDQLEKRVLTIRIEVMEKS